MKYSEKTVRELAKAYDVSRPVIRDVLALLESTPEQQALRAFEQAYLQWALSDAGGRAEGDAFVELVDAYDALEKARD